MLKTKDTTSMAKLNKEGPPGKKYKITEKCKIENNNKKNKQNKAIYLYYNDL